jgi:transcriptional regulator with XRE-family HTH domain
MAGHIRRRPKLLHVKLLAIRQFLNVGQAEMASTLQADILNDAGRHYPIKPGRISDYENGKREPNLFVLMAYAHLGKVHLESAVDDDVKVETFRSRLGQEFDYATVLRRRKDTSSNQPAHLEFIAKPRTPTNKAVSDIIQLPIDLELLVCKYCKKQIYTAGGSRGYLHVNNGAAECAAPQVEDLLNRAKPYDDNTTYVAYRAEIITEITNRIFSYEEARSPQELLEIILADARHFADVNGLIFDEHNRHSYQIYLENKSDAPWLLLSPYAISS